MKAISCWLLVLAFSFGAPSVGLASETASTLRTAADPVSSDLAAEYQAIRAEIEALIEGSDAELIDLQVSRSIATQFNGSEPAPSTQAASCTVSAPVSIPGVEQAAVSVTDPKCAEAAAKFMAAIRALRHEP